MSNSILRSARSRILTDMLGSLKDDKSWRLLVIDNYTLRILNYCVTVEDLKSTGISLIEQISLNRQPFPQMSAIYFLEPSDSSIDRLVKDFKKRKLYKSVHLYLTSKCPDKLILKLKDSELVKKKLIKTFKELNMDFYTVDDHLFSFEMKNDFGTFFTKKTLPQKSIEKLVNRLCNVCKTAKVRPHIRYQGSSELCQSVAQSLEKSLGNKSAKKNSRTIFLILDRSIDMKAPLLHEFTYQCLVYDLMEMKADNKYFADAGRTDLRAILDYRDPVWATYKYKHLMKLNKELKKEFDDFKEENKEMNVDIRDPKIKPKDIAHIIHKIPNFQKMCKYYDLHIGIAVGIQKKYKSMKLQDLALQEQNYATGEILEDGKSTKVDFGDVLELTKILSRNDIDEELKMRHLLLFMVCKGDKRIKKLDDLIEMTGADEDDKKMFDNYQKFFKPLKKVTIKEKKLQKEGIILLSRYETKIKKITNKLIKNNLSEAKFPYVSQPKRDFEFKTVESLNMDSDDDSDDDRIVRKKRLSKWGGFTRKAKEKIVKAEKNRDKLFVFVIGGISLSETRDVVQLGEEKKFESEVGGTSVLTPQIFIDKMMNMYDNEDL